MLDLLIESKTVVGTVIIRNWNKRTALAWHTLDTGVDFKIGCVNVCDVLRWDNFICLYCTCWTTLFLFVYYILLSFLWKGELRRNKPILSHHANTHILSFSFLACIYSLFNIALKHTNPSSLSVELFLFCGAFKARYSLSLSWFTLTEKFTLLYLIFLNPCSGYPTQ